MQKFNLTKMQKVADALIAIGATVEQGQDTDGTWYNHIRLTEDDYIWVARDADGVIVAVTASSDIAGVSTRYEPDLTGELIKIGSKKYNAILDIENRFFVGKGNGEN